ncbi:MAG: hypothetical protein WBB99_18705 [Rhodococcus sp. (in: high G+C Gram-positive bacteria)]
MNRKQRRAKELRQQMIQRKLGATLADAYLRLPEEKQRAWEGLGTNISVSGDLLTAYVTGHQDEPFAFISRRWLSGIETEGEMLEVSETPDTLEELDES